MADTQKTQEFPEELVLYGYPYTTSKDEKRNYIEKKNIEIRLKKGEKESEYIVKDTSKYFWREYNYEFKIVFESTDQNNNVIYNEDSSIIINDTEYNLRFKSDSDRADIGHKNAKGDFLPSRSSPFIDSYPAAQIKIRTKDKKLYCSDCYKVESTHKNIDVEADAAVKYVAEHYNELFSEDPRTSFIGTKLSSRSIAERTLKRQMLETTREVYEHSYAYMRNSPYTRIRNIDEVVPVSRMQSVTPRTVMYIASHTNYLVPAKKGIKYDNDKYCQPAKVLSEQKERTFDVYENRVVMGFLKTILQEIQSMISDTQKEFDDLPQSEERNRLEEERDDLIDIRSKYVNTQKKYGDIFRINARALRTMPKPTPALTATNAYREIYQEIRKWFNGTFVANFCKTLMKFLSTSKLYEYYLLCKMIERFKYHHLFLKQKGNLVFETSSKVFVPTKVVNYFKYKVNTDNSDDYIELYYQPLIEKQGKGDKSDIGLKDVNVNDKNDHYNPDYVIKIQKTFGGIREYYYIILDAKYSTIDNINLYQSGDLKEKYIENISCCCNKDDNSIKHGHTKLGMIILCGQNDDSQRIIEDYKDEKYMLLPAVPGQDNLGSTKNDVDAVIDRVISIFLPPSDILFEDTFGK